MRTRCASFVLCLAFLVTCSGPQTPSETPAGAGEVTKQEEPTGEPFAVFVTSAGEITVKLLPEAAPQTVQRFIELAQVGFYNRTTFHRVMKDRMIQGGDPYSRDRDPYNDGQGTSGEYVPIEPSEVPFERGTVAFGRSPGADNGGSCQFFIVLKRTPEWDGQYNVIGKVEEGIDVATKISQVPLSKDPHPVMKYRPVGKQLIERIRIEYR